MDRVLRYLLFDLNGIGLTGKRNLNLSALKVLQRRHFALSRLWLAALFLSGRFGSLLLVFNLNVEVQLLFKRTRFRLRHERGIGIRRNAILPLCLMTGLARYI